MGQAVARAIGNTAFSPVIVKLQCGSPCHLQKLIDKMSAMILLSTVRKQKITCLGNSPKSLRMLSVPTPGTKVVRPCNFEIKPSKTKNWLHFLQHRSQSQQVAMLVPRCSRLIGLRKSARALTFLRKNNWLFFGTTQDIRLSHGFDVALQKWSEGHLKSPWPRVSLT
jgi:hypothetical protein